MLLLLLLGLVAVIANDVIQRFRAKAEYWQGSDLLHCDQTGTQSLSATKKDLRAYRKGSAVSGR